jgi:hypothetical protein
MIGRSSSACGRWSTNEPWNAAIMAMLWTMRDSRIDATFAVRAVASAVAVSCVYAAHWSATYLAAVALAEGDNATFECWGRTVKSRSESYCRAAWGGWSIVMYLPELVLAGAAIAVAASRSVRVWKWGLGAAAASLIAFVVVLLATHLWALNQMPLIWPPFARLGDASAMSPDPVESIGGSGPRSLSYGDGDPRRRAPAVAAESPFVPGNTQAN